jgi:hypothetical protein
LIGVVVGTVWEAPDVAREAIADDLRRRYRALEPDARAVVDSALEDLDSRSSGDFVSAPLSQRRETLRAGRGEVSHLRSSEDVWAEMKPQSDATMRKARTNADAASDPDAALARANRRQSTTYARGIAPSPAQRSETALRALCRWVAGADDADPWMRHTSDVPTMSIPRYA